MRIISSAAYVDQELSAEFGQIPPAFLPIGVSRLYEAQVASLGPGGPIHLTIPEGFAPQPHDRRRLRELGVVLLEVPPGLRLGEATVYALNLIDAPSGPVRLLHGDTLIEDLPIGHDDLIAVHASGDDYSWAAVDVERGRVTRLDSIMAGTGHGGARPVACGYFACASSTLLVRAITRARGDFIAGLNLYLADRPMRAAPVERWRDFGHIQTYFRSRRAITTERAFNTLQIDARTVRKSSDDAAKIAAEAHWLRTVPPPVQPYAARLLDAGKGYYETEYQYAPTLAELFVFSAIGRPTWRTILDSCASFLGICAGLRGAGSGDAVLGELAVGKTVARLDQFASASGFDVCRPTRLDGRPAPSLTAVAERAGALLDLASGRPAVVMHGDFCFSNILYNSRAGRIAVIDPRGYVRAGQSTIHGDTRYDLAKLSHSVHGYYDHICAGRYALDQRTPYDLSIRFEAGPHHSWLQSTLSEFTIDGVRAGGVEVRATTILLFLSMLPLHADRPDRQAAFVANALRLFVALDA